MVNFLVKYSVRALSFVFAITFGFSAFAACYKSDNSFGKSVGGVGKSGTLYVLRAEREDMVERIAIKGSGVDLEEVISCSTLGYPTKCIIEGGHGVFKLEINNKHPSLVLTNQKFQAVKTDDGELSIVVALAKTSSHSELQLISESSCKKIFPYDNTIGDSSGEESDLKTQ